jgi:beta-D-xylosidase 4
MSGACDLISTGTGEDGCWPHGDESCIVTIAQAIANANTGGQTSITKGCDVNSKHTDGIAGAVAAAKAADFVVLVLGNDRTQEHEGIDRPDINLPGKQEALADAVFAAGKPTMVILSNGGAVSIDNLITPVRQNVARQFDVVMLLCGQL